MPGNCPDLGGQEVEVLSAGGYGGPWKAFFTFVHLSLIPKHLMQEGTQMSTAMHG